MYGQIASGIKVKVQVKVKEVLHCAAVAGIIKSAAIWALDFQGSAIRLTGDVLVADKRMRKRSRGFLMHWAASVVVTMLSMLSVPGMPSVLSMLRFAVVVGFQSILQQFKQTDRCQYMKLRPMTVP